MKRQIQKIIHRPCRKKPVQKLNYEGINSRLKQVCDGIIQELERRNRTLPELLEEYDHFKHKNALLQKIKTFSFMKCMNGKICL